MIFISSSRTRGVSHTPPVQESPLCGQLPWHVAAFSAQVTGVAEETTGVPLAEGRASVGPRSCDAVCDSFKIGFILSFVFPFWQSVLNIDQT